MSDSFSKVTFFVCLFVSLLLVVVLFCLVVLFCFVLVVIRLSEILITSNFSFSCFLWHARNNLQTLSVNVAEYPRQATDFINNQFWFA